MAPGGFSANATEVEQEGLCLPPVKLFKRGMMDEEILAMILSNIRIADQRITRVHDCRLEIASPRRLAAGYPPSAACSSMYWRSFAKAESSLGSLRSLN